MYKNAKVIETRLSQLDNYRDLEGRDRIIAADILKAIEDMGNEATFSNLRNKHIAGIDTFRIFLKWLFERKLVKKKKREKKVRVHQCGRPYTYYELKKDGKEALDFLKIRIRTTEKIEEKTVRCSRGSLTVPLMKEFRLIGVRENDLVKVTVDDDCKIVIESSKKRRMKRG